MIKGGESGFMSALMGGITGAQVIDAERVSKFSEYLRYLEFVYPKCMPIKTGTEEIDPRKLPKDVTLYDACKTYNEEEKLGAMYAVFKENWD